MIFHSMHTPIQFLLSHQVKNGQVSNAQRAHWILLLQGKNRTVTSVQIQSPLPEVRWYPENPCVCPDVGQGKPLNHPT